ncbi:MAG: magnesium-translocating P-type ATPase [Burkholderiaceae bacterium]|nr:MAG: magnesium-translocating P-type ATPase [Burkholderiaceae bacterium]
MLSPDVNVLKELFAGFVRSRHVARHFRRFPFLDTFARSNASRHVSSTLSDALIAIARCDREVVLDNLRASTEGLTDEQILTAREVAGPNEIGHEKPLSWWEHLWHCYKNPFNLLLTVLAAISFVTQDETAALVIGIMVALATMLRFWQEGQSNKAADELKDMVSNTATVMRRMMIETPGVPAGANDDAPVVTALVSQRMEVPFKELVPGDIVLLSAGDMIPADVRLLSAKDLFVSQASMTGESLPVEKFPHLSHPSTTNVFELDNILFMGTNVVSGSASAVVASTGGKTYFGMLAQHATASDRVPTAFQTGVNKVSWLLIRFMFVMSPLVLFINGYTKGDWLEAFLFALSIAVGLTPEMLPMIVTSTLAKGAVYLSRKKVIVKRLDAIQSFGAMDVLCTDKTGTLTQDRIFLERHTDAYGVESDDVLELAYLNSYYQTGLKNLLDVAVLAHGEVHRELDVTSVYRKVDEIPFDFDRRRMSVVVSERREHHLLICKGATEEMLGICTHVRHGEVDETLTDQHLADVRAVTAELNGEGLRVVAVAVKHMPPSRDVYSISDESDLTLVGYIAFLDPPKETTRPAIAALAEHGVAVKVLTGDNELVTLKVCREVGLPTQAVLLGQDVEAMSDAQLSSQVEQIRIFARLAPIHKERIVRALRGNGHVVGFLGDGINDAPALRAADIGISVDSGVDIAKEAADIILLEKNLMVLEQGVIEGRKTFTNMLKYIKITASSNFGNVFSVLIASVFLPFLPMLPLQLLVQNLLYDISQIVIPFDNVDEEMLRRPQSWRPDDIRRFMLFFGPLSSVFDMITFAVMWFVFGANSPAQQTLFQSGWFVVGLLTQTMVVHMIRTPKIPFVQSRASWQLLAMTASVMAVGVFLAMGPLANYFKLQALPPLYFVFLLLVLLGYMGLVQTMKRFYIKRYGWQ